MDEGYFPSPATPIRNNHLASPSPTKGLGSGGSVSSSLLASPPARDGGPLESGSIGDQAHGQEDAAESPAVQQLKRATGFASVRVGLGSPQLALNRGSGKLRLGSDPPEDQGSALPSPTMPQIRMDSSSGLPTPPGTDSDVSAPPLISRTVSGFSQKSDKASPPRPPRHPRRTSSTHLPLLPDPDSPGPSSRTSSPRLPPFLASREASSGISRTSSSSSVLALEALPEDSVHHSGAGPSTSAIQRSPALVTGRSSPRHFLDQNANDRSEILASPSPHRSGAISPRKPHQRSPSLPTETVTRRPAYRSNPSHPSGSSRNTVQEDETIDLRSPVDASMDDRIRQAEDQIKQSSLRRPRASGAADTTSPASGQLRRHESYSRNANSPSAYTSSTLRRSATLSSASVLTPNGDHDSSSSGRRYGPARVTGLNDSTEREHSGGSGSSGRRKPIPADFRNGGLFTPSPKASPNSIQPSHEPTNSAQRRAPRPSYSPEESKTYSSPNRYTPNSRSEQTHTSPLDRVRAARHTEIDGIPREETSLGRRREEGGYVRRQWQESISGLPKYCEPESNLPRSGGGMRRAESVLGTAGDRNRYQSRGGSAGSATGPERYGGYRDSGLLPSRGSRYALGPSDSVSVVGASRSEIPEPSRKDPLEVIKRMEQSRAEHQKQWEVERSASVIGDSSHASGYPRPSSRLFDSTPRRHRPGTSMASLRDVYDQPAPRTAPIDDWRSRRDQAVAAAESPLIARAGPRAYHQPVKPATEPRPLRSSTSLGGRTDSSLDFAAPATEHGRLLFEACRALELKLGTEVVEQLPDLLKTFQSSARSSEAVNSALRSIVKVADEASVHLDLDDTIRARDEIAKLSVALREASRTSDQNVRELTRLLLDLPKLLRQAERGGASRLMNRPSMELDRRPSPVDQFAGRVSSRYDGSPGRASHDILRPSTSMGEVTSPLHRYSLDSRRPMLQPRSQQSRDRDRSSTMSNLVAKMRGLNSHSSPLPKHSELNPIEQSPPNQTVERLPSSSSSKSKSRSSLALSASPTKSNRSASPTKMSQSSIAPAPPPRSPERKVLRKKASAASNHTVRGTSSFLPASSQVRTTTALSAVNAGELFDTELTPAKSIRSIRTTSTRDQHMGSPASRFSFGFDGPDDEREARGSMDGSARGEDAVAVLEHSLAAAAKNRDEGEYKPSMGERFRASLRRGPSQRVKE